VQQAAARTPDCALVPQVVRCRLADSTSLTHRVGCGLGGVLGFDADRLVADATARVANPMR
jgi:hypothetical protein